MTDTEQAKKDEPVVINGVTMQEGRVYLRDKRNGTVYQYEETLSRMGFIESFIYGEKEPTVDLGAVVVPAAMTPEQRAQAWDDRARKNLKAGEVTEVAAEGEAANAGEGAQEAQTAAPATPPAPPTAPATPVAPTGAQAPPPPPASAGKA